MFGSDVELVDVDRRGRDVEDGCGRIFREIERTDLSGVPTVTKIIPVASELEVTMWHRLEIGDTLLESELVFIVEKICDLSDV